VTGEYQEIAKGRGKRGLEVAPGSLEWGKHSARRGLKRPRLEKINGAFPGTRDEKKERIESTGFSSKRGEEALKLE